jgi:hypothetical protein
MAPSKWLCPVVFDGQLVREVHKQSSKVAVQDVDYGESEIPSVAWEKMKFSA